ncbi:glycosyltransferase family 4 protein [Clostridium sp. CS001]|uniref:glycosyltransferase family 4 protein n=1 Tax=Clostridium sp. CS001 TaxID=2880648 RepID=UPI001CF2F913|nr:glycosyltransferase family 4 protein [Clostridium sp. CS001]MCB2289032.1 glycosyltransferase family 4 protein [Clostridium sp. CS001]
MRYFMQYLKTANVNLVKDMGMIPYLLYKKYGYDSTVVTYKNGEYSYLQKDLMGLKIDFVKKIFNNYSLDGALHLLKYGQSMDIIQIFHVTLSSVAYVYSYKFKNKMGKVYLKLDCSHKLVERITELSKIQLYFLERFLNKVDLISIEQEELYYRLKKILKKHENKIINIPNGIDFQMLTRKGLTYDFSKKENVILNVARIGTEEKDTPMLLEAFANISNIENLDWKLKLIGTIEEDFNTYIQQYFKKYPKLINKVIFLGEITDRIQIFHEYAKAKIFSLTSRFESFGIAFIEAAAMGDVIVSTDVGIAKELVCDDNGELVNIGDVASLTKAFEKYISEIDFQKHADKTYNVCKQRFDWDIIIQSLNDSITKIVK